MVEKPLIVLDRPTNLRDGMTANPRRMWREAGGGTHADGVQSSEMAARNCHLRARGGGRLVLPVAARADCYRIRLFRQDRLLERLSRRPRRRRSAEDRRAGARPSYPEIHEH